MSLLAFELTGPSPVSDLLTPAQRQKLASELNRELLLSQSQEKDPKVKKSRETYTGGPFLSHESRSIFQLHTLTRPTRTYLTWTEEGNMSTRLV